MPRGLKTILFIVTVLVALMLAGNIVFTMHDDRLSENSGFAIAKPEAALERITQIAEDNGRLLNSGVGVTIPAEKSASLGPTQWSVTADGTISGAAPERGLAVLLTPEMRDGKVTWHCKLEPSHEFLRNICRHMPINQR